MIMVYYSHNVSDGDRCGTLGHYVSVIGGKTTIWHYIYSCETMYQILKHTKKIRKQTKSECNASLLLVSSHSFA